MKTQLEQARDGVITELIRRVAEDEGLAPELIRDRVAAGEIVIPNNPNRPNQKVVGIGTGLRTKVNASIG
ncbi:MAG: phosphomethylpyrimidine synthase ThiC, partial [Desulfobulbaceae bacterium]|nr:phosphomethylpyrimidine synthase ThiC [Desulfobulbaceae bacterium]